MADPWSDINDPGFFFKPQKAQPAPQEQQADTASNKKNDVEVRLSDPQWKEGPDGYTFNKKATISVAVQYLKETPRARVGFEVFVETDGNREGLHEKVDGFEKDGRAEAEITLFYGDAYSQKLNDDPSAICKYIFKATHPTGEKPVESPALEMPQSDADDSAANIHMEDPRVVCGSKTMQSGTSRRAVDISGDGSSDMIFDSPDAADIALYDQQTSGTALSLPYALSKNDIKAGKKFFLEYKKAGTAKNGTELVVRKNASAAPSSSMKVTIAEAGLDVYSTKKKGAATPDVIADDKKTSVGRFLHVQDPGRNHARAKIVVKRVVPNDFEGALVLTAWDVNANAASNSRIDIFEAEIPAAGQSPLALPLEIQHNSSFPAAGKTYWVQGKAASNTLRDVEIRLGVKVNGTVVSDCVDRISFTIVNFSEIKATILPTPSNTLRPGIAGPANHEFKSNSHSNDFSINQPLVLMRNAQPQISIEVTAEPNNLPVSWIVIRNKDDAAGLGGAGDLPAITPDASNKNLANLGLDQKGSFYIRPFIDCNGSGAFESEEPSIPLTLILADTQWVADNSALHAGNLTATVEAWGVSITNGQWANTPLQAPDLTAAGMAMEVIVDLTGGGNDGRLGLDRVFAGLVNNLRPVDISVVYRDSTGATPVDYTISNTYVSNRTAATGNYGGPGSPMFRPTDPPPAAYSFPLLDTGRANGGSGGDSATMTRSIQPTSVNRPLGVRWTIRCIDCPGRGFLWDHPDHPNAHLHRIHYIQRFSAHFCFWTNAKLNRAPTNDAAERVYSVANTGPWEVTGDWNVTAPSGGNPGAIINTSPHTGAYAGSPVNPIGRAQDHSIEVRPPSGITTGIAWRTT